MCYKCYIGIDVGKTGGLTLLDQDGNFLEAIRMPPQDNVVGIDINVLKEFFYYENSAVIVENQHAYPKQGVVSVFSLGKSFGTIIGLFSTLGFDVYTVNPKSWQKHFSIAGENTKDQSIEKACDVLNIDPSILITKRGRKLHGISDSILVARYGYEKLRGDNVKFHSIGQNL